MKRGFLDIAGGEARRLGRDESGIAVMFVLCSFLFLFIVCLSVWFFGENIRRKAELQNVCDAAAYSAATVQADGLSRMAVINRAMSWCYIQMTKMQLDYITMRWLELTKERYEKDKRNTRPTPLGRMFTHKAGFHTFEHEWKRAYGVRQLLKAGIPIGVPWLANVKIQFGFDCHDKIHNKPQEGEGSYIGFKDGKHINHIRINRPITAQSDLDKVSTWLSEGELNYAVKELQDDYGKGGTNLAVSIRAMKNAITTFNALLPLINRQMATAIEETAVKTLYENLPRDNNGNVDQSILDDYRWTVAGGVSKPPAQYPSGSGGFDTVNEIMCAIDDSYFSGLKNTEEDEMVFLNMADGIPRNLRAANGEVRLIDYFVDENSTAKPTASGLDQWFIRCNPMESQDSQSVKIARDFTAIPNGIIRAYKNANYNEGASAPSKLQSLMGSAFKGIHRGNYVTDILDLGIDHPDISKEFGLSKDEIDDLKKAGFNGYTNFSGVKKISDGGMSKHAHVTSKPKHKALHWNKYCKHVVTKAVHNVVKAFDSQFSRFMNPVQGAMNKVSNVANKLANGFFKLDVEPSCVNDRLRFVDQCANVRNTTALVSEYEWASAYWFCNWGKISAEFCGKNASFKWCIHPFLPMAALHGGRKDAKADSPFHTLDEKGTDSYSTWKEFLGGLIGYPLTWFSEEYRMFAKDGHSRDKYRSSFMSLDGDIPTICYPHNTYWYLGFNGGRHSNYLFKGFTRIYGDDRKVYDSCYYGVPARPWILNEKYFQGGGSIIVGISRKQRNVFDWIVDAVKQSDSQSTVESPSIYSAFSPVEAPEQHFVALAAARAGYAPRTGYRRAEGNDSVNEGSRPARQFEVRYDAVLDKKLGVQGYPLLPQKVKGLDEGTRRTIEHNARIGCVCGTPNTTKRLRREWNLSQTDWDAVLLPLRHAYARHTAYDSANSTTTKWDFPDLSAMANALIDDEDIASLAATGDSVDLCVRGLLFGQAKWRPFIERGLIDDRRTKTLRTRDVIPLPKGSGTPAQLFRRRRIL